MAVGDLRRSRYSNTTHVSDHAVYTRGRLRRPCAAAGTQLAFIGSEVHGGGWRRLGAAQSGSLWNSSRQQATQWTGKERQARSSQERGRRGARTHLGGRPTSIPGRVVGPRGAGGCFERGGENWSLGVVCAVEDGDGGKSVRLRLGRRRRIKAACGAHGEKQTRVCVCLIPRGTEEVPRGRRQRGSLGTHKEPRPGGTTARDAETTRKRGTPQGDGRARKRGSARRRAILGTAGEATAQPASRTHAEEASGRGEGGGLAGPGARPPTPKPRTPPTHP